MRLTAAEAREAGALVKELGLAPSVDVWLDRDRYDNLELTADGSEIVFPVMIVQSRESRVRQWNKVNR